MYTNMYGRKVLRMVRIGLVAAMVVAPLMVVTGNAVAYDEATHNGTDSFQSEARVDVLVDFFPTDGVPETPFSGIILRSPPDKDMVVERSSVGHDGNEPLDFHIALRDAESEPDDHEDIGTEIKQMVLRGFAGTIAITIRAGSEFGLPPSIGAVESQSEGEDADFPDWADSWFDIYLELTLVPDIRVWGTLKNDEPAHMAAEINSLPPYNTDYTLLDPPVAFKDGTGEIRVLLNAESHTPLPDVMDGPVFPSLYFGVAAAFAVGILAYLLRRRLVHQN